MRSLHKYSITSVLFFITLSGIWANSCRFMMTGSTDRILFNAEYSKEEAGIVGIPSDYIDGYISETASEFIAASEAEYEKARSDWNEPLPCSFVWNKDMKLSFFSGLNGLVSMLQRDVLYTGGAHPNTFYHSRHFRLTDGKPEAVFPDEIFVNGSSEAERLREILRNKLSDLGAAWVPDGSAGSITGLPPFTADESGISFYFEPYTAGPYSQGTFIVEVSYTDLEGLFLFR